MLEKSLQNCVFFDSHLHLSQCIKQNDLSDKLLDFFPEKWCGCSCQHSKNEWDETEEILKKINSTKNNFPKVYNAYGLHPIYADKIQINKDAEFLEKLIIDKKICAIGETGFDFFRNEYKSLEKKQTQMWDIQLQLAIKYNLPLIIHARKANQKLFEYSKELSKVKSVLFHSFMGTYQEAVSLINKEINCYFSFGKQMNNNNKKVIECVQKLPEQKILLETDAPFQFLKSENKTNIIDICTIYDSAINLRNVSDITSFCNQLKTNFCAMFDC